MAGFLFHQGPAFNLSVSSIVYYIENIVKRLENNLRKYFCVDNQIDGPDVQNALDCRKYIAGYALAALLPIAVTTATHVKLSGNIRRLPIAARRS